MTSRALGIGWALVFIGIWRAKIYACTLDYYIYISEFQAHLIEAWFILNNLTCEKVMQ